MEQKMQHKKKKIIYFNPPYNQNTKRNFGKILINLIDKYSTNQVNCTKHPERNILKFCCNYTVKRNRAITCPQQCSPVTVKFEFLLIAIAYNPT